MAAPYELRIYGDPVLKAPSTKVTAVTQSLRTLANDMIDTMYASRGVGLAGPQIGVRKQIFVYDAGDGPHTMLNPEIADAQGTWEFEEGCLSVPKLYFAFERPRTILFRGMDLDEKPVEFRVEGYLARILQHETDHLCGTLILDRLSTEQRQSALRTLRMREAT